MFLIQQKIKCDETKPNCINCEKSGCPCPGYQKQIRWSHTVVLRGSSTPQNSLQPDHRGLSSSGNIQAAQTQDILTQAYPENLLGISDNSQHKDIAPSDTCDLLQLTDFSLALHATDVDISASHGSDQLEASHPSNSTRGLIPMHHTSIIQGPVDLSTTLIEYWLKHICPVRSTFDSEVNNNRSIARDSWTISEPVFYTMQAMSATCLSKTMSLGESLQSLTQRATLAISQAIFRAKILRVAPVTADLLFAVLAMGTSSHWVMSGFANDFWLESAHELLSIWSNDISKEDALLHAYFRQALSYWEMLLTALGPSPNLSKINMRRQKYSNILHQAMPLDYNSTDAISEGQLMINSTVKPLGTLPNSWCGISNEVIETFGLVMALCRTACDFTQDAGASTLQATSKALCDIAVAQELEKELLGMDFEMTVLLEEVQGFYVDTQDRNTPVSHLLQTAEAYRKAGLLQLYLTFDELPVDSSGSCQTGRTGAGDSVHQESRAKYLVELALQLVATLEKIPAESGSKFIHPMLYLSAAAGLRFNRLSDSYTSEMSDGHNNIPDSDWVDQSPQALHTSDSLAAFIPRTVLKVARGRRLVWSRLVMIRDALPYKSDSLLRVIKAIWSEYDRTQADAVAKHWLKILSQTKVEMPL